MALIAQKEVDVPGWVPWSDSHSLISRELRGVDRANLKGYFQALHGFTEAVFRRSLLVGLRMHQVQFKDAEGWLHDHDETPDRKEFPKRFDRLYSIRGTSWAKVTSQSESFRCALNLWHDYSKIVRNHLAHAIRSYSDEWLTWQQVLGSRSHLEAAANCASVAVSASCCVFQSLVRNVDRLNSACAAS